MPLFAFVALVVHFVMRLSKSFMRIDCFFCRFPFLGFIKTSSNGTSVITSFLTLFHMFGSIQTLSKSSHIAGVDPIRTVLLLRLYHVHGCRILVRLIAFDVLQRVPRSLCHTFAMRISLFLCLCRSRIVFRFFSFESIKRFTAIFTILSILGFVYNRWL